MFCSNCGYSTDESSKYCGGCGAYLGELNPPKKKSSKMQKGIIIGCILVIILLIAIVFIAIVFMCVPKTINLNEYVDVEFEGYDTVGTVHVTFDEDEFWLDYGDKIKFNDTDAANQYNRLYDFFGTEPIEGFLSLIHVSASQTEGLSNEDEINLEWNCNDLQIENYFNYKIEYTDEEFTVEGLAEVETFNPFEDISISFTGISPNGHVQINNDSMDDIYTNLAFVVDKTSGLANGEEITVWLETRDGRDVATYCAEEYGLVPVELFEIYTVSGLGDYITQLNEIPEDILESMNRQSQDVITSYVANEWEKCNTLDSITYLGNYFLAPKANGETEKHNIIYMVYYCTCTLNISDKWWGEASSNDYFYFVVGYSDIYLDDMNLCNVSLSDYFVPDITVFWKKYYPNNDNQYEKYETYGFVDVEHVFRECVETKVDTYTYESNVVDVEY